MVEPRLPDCQRRCARRTVECGTRKCTSPCRPMVSASFASPSKRATERTAMRSAAMALGLWRCVARASAAREAVDASAPKDLVCDRLPRSRSAAWEMQWTRNWPEGFAMISETRDSHFTARRIHYPFRRRGRRYGGGQRHRDRPAGRNNREEPQR